MRCSAAIPADHIMSSSKLLLVIILNIIAASSYGSSDILFTDQDTVKENQILYNGRLWRNPYTKVREDQFIFTPDLITGSIATQGRIFKNVPLKYDIYKDELLTETPHGLMLQLNKEMVDSFSLNYNGSDYLFVRSDSSSEYSGYVNLLYTGKSSFKVKYRKNIELLAVDKKYDQFYLIRKMYLVRDGSIDQFAGRLEFMRLLGDRKKEVRSFMKKNRINPSKNNPESFIPVIKFYDSIR